ncbi:MAG: pyridoxal phosphate-dependent aminotransferase [Candidatus Roizmanbacteria bacterium]|nr:pyridoxal phosphate-dependent aminotransferase [Candidatus Roizmanbacteria bacterium]
MRTLSHRLQQLPISSIRKLIPLSDAAKKNGVKIYHLNMGQPDVKTPQVMIDALQKWNINPIAYAPSGGTADYLQALETYYHDLGFLFVNTKNILGTIAGSEGINMAMFAVCDPGDEILVFEPFYSSYKTSAQMWGINLVPIETSIETGFHFPSQEKIETLITPKTKAILYSNPCNPTGTVYTKEEVQLLIDIVKKHNVYLLSDEVYREYTFVDRPHISILKYMQEIPQQAVLIDSLSKRYNLCGARLGNLVTLNTSIFSGALKFAMSRLSGGIVDQYIGAQLVHVPKSYTQDMQKEYQSRRDIMFEGLSKIPGVVVTKPEGAFYIMAELPIDDAETFSIWLLEKFRDDNETVMLAPGYGFYDDPEKGKTQVRIAYVLEEKYLRRSVEILEIALQKYNN